jgi:CRISPR-associated protein Csb2
MFAIAWQYLTGRAVATDPTDRQAAEWPPHPDRVFQALVAAWAGIGEDAAQRAALAWLAAQGTPLIAAPHNDGAGDAVAWSGAKPKTYVPVNDLEGPRRGEYPDLALLPAHRTRKERYFPATVIGDQTCALIWPAAEPTPAQRDLLATTCAAVTNVGHSSSLVRMWIDPTPPTATWTPVADRAAEIHVRVPDPQRVETLTTAHAQAVAQCAARPGSPAPLPPRAPWQGYSRAQASGTASGAFLSRLVVLRCQAGERVDLVQTLALATALRDTLNRHAADAIRPLVSGHAAADNTPLDRAHLAIMPLPFVGDAHADGHVLGFALALPRDLSADDEDSVWQALAHAADEQGNLRIVAGRAGAVTLAIEQRPAPPLALRAGRWCREATTWATVTPIVIDRLPPRRHADLDGWMAEQIGQACLHQGLPAPSEVAILGASRLRGAPAARAMPPWLRKDGTRRWHTHAQLTFPCPVAGPLLLGAGRYRGCGLCAPIAGGHS